MKTSDHETKKKLHCIFCCKISGHSRQQLHIFVKEIPNMDVNGTYCCIMYMQGHHL